MRKKRHYMRLSKVFLFFLITSLLFAIVYFTTKIRHEEELSEKKEVWQENAYLRELEYEAEIRRLNREFDDALRRIEALDERMEEIRQRSGMEDNDV